MTLTCLGQIHPMEILERIKYAWAHGGTVSCEIQMLLLLFLVTKALWTNGRVSALGWSDFHSLLRDREGGNPNVDTLPFPHSVTKNNSNNAWISQPTLPPWAQTYFILTRIYIGWVSPKHVEVYFEIFFWMRLFIECLCDYKTLWCNWSKGKRCHMIFTAASILLMISRIE